MESRANSASPRKLRALPLQKTRSQLNRSPGLSELDDPAPRVLFPNLAANIVNLDVSRVAKIRQYGITDTPARPRHARPPLPSVSASSNRMSSTSTAALNTSDTGGKALLDLFSVPPGQIAERDSETLVLCVECKDS